MNKKIDLITALTLLNPDIYDYNLTRFRKALFEITKEDLKTFSFDNQIYLLNIYHIIIIIKINQFLQKYFSNYGNYYFCFFFLSFLEFIYLIFNNLFIYFNILKFLIYIKMIVSELKQQYKVILIGEMNIRKTSIIIQFIKHEFHTIDFS